MCKFQTAHVYVVSFTLYVARCAEAHAIRGSLFFRPASGVSLVERLSHARKGHGVYLFLPVYTFVYLAGFLLHPDSLVCFAC